MRALVADDDDSVRRLIEVLLDRWGFDVVAVGNGEAAWHIMNSQDAPQLAILDRMMPGLDGLELCRRIRARAHGPATYILLLTSLDQKEDMVAGLEAGANDYIAKPCFREELEVRVSNGRRFLEIHNELIEARRTIRQLRTAG